MLDIIKGNIGQVIDLVQNRFGQLNEEEVGMIRENPSRLFTILKDKFSASESEVQLVLAEEFKGKANPGMPENQEDQVTRDLGDLLNK